jgi:phage baseplate assembly protein W
MSAMNLAFPFSFDTTGRTAQASIADHVNQMIELILFTAPGERVNLPTFGSGTAQLVFHSNSDVLAAAQQQAIQAGLQQWLSDLIRVNSVQVTPQDSTLLVTVAYTLVANQQQQSQQFLYAGPTQ